MDYEWAKIKLGWSVWPIVYAAVVWAGMQVHQSSTDAASSLLVTALNEGRDVILDGTLSWEPFVEQTIAMARADRALSPARNGDREWGH